MRRRELSEQEWKIVEPHTLGRLSRGLDNRLLVKAVLYRVRTGISWRDLPERFGPWNTAARRFRRWAPAGVWEALFRAVRAGTRLRPGAGRFDHRQGPPSGGRAKKARPQPKA